MKRAFFFLSLILVGNFMYAQTWSNGGGTVGFYEAGTLGIGSSGVPSSKVEIVTTTQGDGIYMLNNGSSYGGTSGFLHIQASSLSQGSWNGLTAAGDAGIIFGTGSQTTTFGFVVAPWNSGTTGLRVDNSGNVGICTTSTQGYQLAVNGKAIFTQAVVKLYANWPDYVFQPGYQLPSLKSVGEYIRANGHLPGMPTADSVQQHGLDLGMTQAKLLEKVEQLTLYTIELQQQVEQLQAENKKLSQAQPDNAKLESLQQQIDALKAAITK